MDDESEPGTRSACDDKLKLDYIIASNNDIAKAIPSAVVHNRENQRSPSRVITIKHGNKLTTGTGEDSDGETSGVDTNCQERGRSADYPTLGTQTPVRVEQVMVTQ